MYIKLGFDPMVFLGKNWPWMVASVFVAVALIWVFSIVIAKNRLSFWLHIAWLFFNVLLFVVALFCLPYELG